jgi:hypothetical protein
MGESRRCNQAGEQQDEGAKTVISCHLENPLPNDGPSHEWNDLSTAMLPQAWQASNARPAPRDHVSIPVIERSRAALQKKGTFKAARTATLTWADGFGRTGFPPKSTGNRSRA